MRLPIPGQRARLAVADLWVLTIVVAIKYALVILRADNQGEGGTMVLLAMALRTASNAKRRRALTLLGIFGVSLFFGDSIVTPAVSVLGAMEGLKEINEDWLVAVVPVTVVILIGLFYVQRTGTGKVQRLVWPDHGALVCGARRTRHLPHRIQPARVLR